MKYLEDILPLVTADTMNPKAVDAKLGKEEDIIQLTKVLEKCQSERENYYIQNNWFDPLRTNVIKELIRRGFYVIQVFYYEEYRSCDYICFNEESYLTLLKQIEPKNWIIKAVFSYKDIIKHTPPIVR